MELRGNRASNTFLLCCLLWARHFCLFALIAIPLFSNAQKTRILGTVTNAENSEVLPFVNVAFEGSRVGTVTDSSGQFLLETNRNFDSLQVSFVGFHRQSFAVEKGVTEELDVNLIPSSVQLSEVTIGPGENLAWPILRKVVAAKADNRPESLDAYEHEVYHLSLIHI